MFAYLDAGSGSMILAAFAGGVAGIGVLLKLYWHRILGVFSKKHREAATQAATQLTSSEDAPEMAAADDTSG